MKRWLKIIIAVALVLVVVGVMAWRRAASKKAEVKTHVVSRRTVDQEVTFTGHLRSKQRAAIAFESTGTLREITVDVGDKVTVGQTLARLDSRELSLQAAKARADQAAAAQKSYQAWQDALSASQKVAAENGTSLETKRQTVRDAKTAMDQALDVWQQSVRESGDESSTAKTKYSAFITAQGTWRAAQKTLTQSEATAAKTDQAAAGQADEARSAYISTQQAAPGVTGLSSSQALEATANLRLAKAVAVAPFDGVVTTKSFQAGELAAAGQVVVTVESIDDLEAVADVPESDITKLKVGLPAAFTLDAFVDGRQVKARIESIAPAAKVLEGVPTYEVVLSLPSQADLRPGMTANVTVQTAHKENVVAVPRRAVARVGGLSKVKVVQAGRQVEREVVPGILGTDGLMEITSGLQAGERVVVPSGGGNGAD